MTTLKPHRSKKIFVLDTNVLMHDSTSIFRFHEHDIYLPMIVLEELDRNKGGRSEPSRNARQASRFINDMLEKFEGDLNDGLPIVPQIQNDDCKLCTGRLFFQTRPLEETAEGARLVKGVNDNIILQVALSLEEQYPDRVILVSKDINLRIKAAIVGIEVEDYFNDQILDDANLLYKGFSEYDTHFWEQFDTNLESWTEEEGRSFYKVQADEVKNWIVGQGLFVGSDNMDYIVRDKEGETAIIEPLHDYHDNGVWGIKARNKGQNFALNILLDPDIDFVTLLGAAGTGKTLLALAAGLHEVLETKKYDQIIMTRATVSVGEDIGFLPGTEEEKMAPWMGALMDNLEVLMGDHQKDDWSKGATNDLLAHRIKIKSLNFMRGRTFQNKWVIIDEAQNLTSKQMKTLITRAGENTKVICLGNIGQIDTPYLTETTSGLTYVVEKFQGWKYSAHITLQQGERSRLALYASDNL